MYLMYSVKTLWRNSGQARPIAKRQIAIVYKQVANTFHETINEEVNAIPLL